MSDENADDTQQGGVGPSEEEARALVERLRVAPAEEMLTEVLSTLLSTAQVKLGRRDARLFIDLAAVVLDHAKGVVSDDVRGQVDAALGQLRVGQVAAERDVAAGGSEPNDLSSTPSPPTREGQTQPAPSGPREPASGLWVPGR